ncbi:MAG TPA: CbiX/SirB N-terminal domain-containing protein [Burkholderiaceae bacterium]|nr:CbiX/SirB N-terminal domain-containing protein [Burkholderiaceae bacterium]
MAAQRGIVLLAHGSRDPLWRKPVEAVAERIRALDATALVRCGYLELTEPDLAGAVAQLTGQGARSIRVLPLFLGMGKHAREDLPSLLEELRAAHPQVAFELATTVGEDSRLVDLLARIALT